MRQIFKNLFLLASLILLFSFILPEHRAFAMDPTNYDNCATNTQNNLTSEGQRHVTLSHQIMTSMPPVDARLFSCLQIIKAAFALNVALGNPGNLLKAIVTAAILAILNEVCTIALQTINQLKASALSLFNFACLPLPKFLLSGGLHLPVIPCNGVNLLQPMITQGSTPTPPGYWQIWGQPKQ